MKLTVFLMLVAACSHDTVRSREKLVQEIGDFAQQMQRGGPVQPGDLVDVRPPSEQELRWIADPSDHDPLERQILGIRLTKQCREIGKAYAQQHRPEAAAWLVAGIDVFAEMVDAEAGEMKSSSDPEIAQVAAKDLGELAGMSIDSTELQVRNYYGLPLPVYIQVVAGWRARAAKLRRMWTQTECDKVGGMIAIRVLGENDARAKQALQDLANELHSCKGVGR